jgi:hypothetical protein
VPAQSKEPLPLVMFMRVNFVECSQGHVGTTEFRRQRAPVCGRSWTTCMWNVRKGMFDLEQSSGGNRDVQHIYVSFSLDRTAHLVVSCDLASFFLYVYLEV